MTTNVRYRERDRLEIDEVWSGTSAAFDLATANGRQFVAFYDPERNITVGARDLGDADWQFVRLPEARKVKWDAHNSLELTVDNDGYLHLTGNMHVHPLNYFRTTEPGDVSTFERVAEMVGSEEDQVTYPQFLRGPSGELVFKYRDGYSGGGDWIYNVYNPDSQEWDRLLDEPLTAGGDEMNAYPHGPVIGPDGRYHLCWVWRDRPGAQTNHDLSYARSEDLREWETSRGRSLDLPIAAHTGEVVDPVPPYGGMINNNTKIGFDHEDRVVVSYHKFDPDGNTQVYNARAEADGWEIYRTSDWDYRWSFGGGGTIPFEIRLGPVERENDRLTQWYEHVEYGTGKWVLDEETLTPIEWLSPWYTYPKSLRKGRNDYPGMQVNWVAEDGRGTDAGTGSETDVTYALRWEALEPNRDVPREELPPATTLTLHEFEPRE